MRWNPSVAFFLLFTIHAHAETTWLKTTVSEPKGVFILAHGLNTKPEKMDSLGIFLTGLGYEVLRIDLPGHHGPIEEMKKITLDQWLHAGLTHYKAAQKRAEDLGKPLYYMGFSMGALLGETLTAIHPELKKPKKFILFAPAFAIRDRSHLVSVMGIFGDEHIVASYNHEDYKAQKGVSVAGYKALFKMEKIYLETENPGREAIPSLIYINPDDQLISIKKIQDLVSNRKWAHTTVIPLTDQEPEIERTFSHLIIDKPSLGEKAWNRVTSEVSAFLANE